MPFDSTTMIFDKFEFDASLTEMTDGTNLKKTAGIKSSHGAVKVNIRTDKKSDDCRPENSFILEKTSLYSASGHENSTTVNSDLEKRTEQDAFKAAFDLVNSLSEVPPSVRRQVTRAIERRINGSAINLSEWHPEEKFCNRTKQPNLGRKENVAEFLRRVWAPWIATGELPLSVIKAHDPSAYRAVYNWRDQELPDDLHIKNRSEIATHRIAMEAHLPAGDRTARTDWTLKARKAKHPVAALI